MSDQAVKSVNDTNGRSEQTVQSYQSVWMAHWMRRSCDAAGETCSHSASGNEELDYATTDDNLTNGLDISSKSVKGLGVIETKTFKIVDEIIKMSSKSMGNKRMRSSLFKYGQDTDDTQALRPVFGHNLEGGKAVDCKSGIQFPSVIPGLPAANRIFPGGCHSPGEGTSKYPPKRMETLQEKFVESSSHIVPYMFDLEKYAFDKGKAAVSPLFSKSVVVSKQLPNANVIMLEHEQGHEHSQSADLVCERKMDCHSQSDNSANACFREGIACDHYLSTFGRDRLRKMQKCSGIRLFPSQCLASEETKKSYKDCYSQLKLQNCVDVETMRICTTVDALEGTPGGCPRLSQTTQSLLNTKQTDVNLSKENDILISTRVIPKLNRNISSGLHHQSPFFGQGKRRGKPQPPSSSIDSEAKEHVGDVEASKVTIKNESSAETDTKDMDSCKEKNLLSGSYSTVSTKKNKTITGRACVLPAFNMESNLPWINVASSREVGCPRPNIELPDINLELPALPGAASSSENMCHSSSKTQSFEMDKLLAHVELPKPKSNFSLDDCPNADPCNRWVKRLKLTSSNSSAQGTKSSNLAETSSHEKISKLFSRIPKSSMTSSEPTPRKHHGKESVLSDKSGDFLKKDEDPKNKGTGLLLSHAWIQRWLHNGSGISKKKPETVVVFEPQSSKLALKNLQKVQFPSIAAMALMGKALTCFQPCELQKRGSFTVWNTNAF
ncbi:hypothetical protein Pfo_002796 [Paulownia fortunei]|nr:hypothetical protein Pfo_002796 [Paulownia fortunei]